MYNNFVKPSVNGKPEKRQRRKPVSQNFVPKRLAISIEPPMIILQYMVPDSGKLYHHKMRLQSKMQQTFNTKQLLDYLKTKHTPYFTKGNLKLKEDQVQKLIQKIVSQYEEYEESEKQKEIPKQTTSKLLKVPGPQLVKDFDFLDQEDGVEDEYGKQQWNLQMGEDADIV